LPGRLIRAPLERVPRASVPTSIVAVEVVAALLVLVRSALNHRKPRSGTELQRVPWLQPPRKRTCSLEIIKEPTVEGKERVQRVLKQQTGSPLAQVIPSRTD
jgi:hypothetical protein